MLRDDLGFWSLVAETLVNTSKSVQHSIGFSRGVCPLTTLLYTHPACLDHDPGRHHPESPARLRAVLAALEDPEFSSLERREAPEAGREDLLRVHPRRHVEGILGAVPETGHVGIDADTVLSPASG